MSATEKPQGFYTALHFLEECPGFQLQLLPPTNTSIARPKFRIAGAWKN